MQSLGGESNFVYFKTNIGKYFKPTNLPQILAEEKKWWSEDIYKVMINQFKSVYEETKLFTGI